MYSFEGVEAKGEEVVVVEVEGAGEARESDWLEIKSDAPVETPEKVMSSKLFARELDWLEIVSTITSCQKVIPQLRPRGGLVFTYSLIKAMELICSMCP